MRNGDGRRRFHGGPRISPWLARSSPLGSLLLVPRPSNPNPHSMQRAASRLSGLPLSANAVKLTALSPKALSYPLLLVVIRLEDRGASCKPMSIQLRAKADSSSGRSLSEGDCM